MRCLQLSLSTLSAVLRLLPPPSLPNALNTLCVSGLYSGAYPPCALSALLAPNQTKPQKPTAAPTKPPANLGVSPAHLGRSPAKSRAPGSSIASLPTASANLAPSPAGGGRSTQRDPPLGKRDPPPRLLRASVSLAASAALRVRSQCAEAHQVKGEPSPAIPSPPSPAPAPIAPKRNKQKAPPP